MKTVNRHPFFSNAPSSCLFAKQQCEPNLSRVEGQEAQACCALGQALHLSIPSIKAYLGDLCAPLSSSSSSQGLPQVTSGSPWRAGKPDTWQAKARRQDPGFRRLFMELWQGVGLLGLLLLKVQVTHCL